MSTPNDSQTTCKWFANQMRVCVDGTVNLRCAVHELFAYRSLRTEICRCFARTQRELDMPPCIGCPLLASGSQKINQPRAACAPLTQRTPTTQRISGKLVYTKLKYAEAAQAQPDFSGSPKSTRIERFRFKKQLKDKSQIQNQKNSGNPSKFKKSRKILTNYCKLRKYHPMTPHLWQYCRKSLKFFQNFL